MKLEMSNEKKTKPTGKVKRATKERDIVNACKVRMEEKVLMMATERNKSKRRVAEMEEDILRFADAGEDEVVIQRMIEDRDFVIKQIDFTDGMIAVFSAVRNVLLDLTVELDALLTLEWYGYVIRTVPERKLPKMLRSEKQKDLIKVMEITQKILQKIEDKIAATIIDKREFERVMKRIKDTSKEMKKKYVGDDSTSVQSAVEEIRNRAKITVGVMPVPVENTATTASFASIKS
ncbi:MAG: hypothetical protein IJ514_07045 [Clostridia bacterium]|nr:hypothetical protein [Clostridia bacterium]